ncbi:hypothetical protein PVAP13_6NG144803 [Panicum virgatum]|uniref:Uncharacterized protein n=1 Tax=Panicum virgatum TaxID=38727 RepID=A0A8T0R056_PANVG|nr:hypothetical protein PVAP13_6NG144803 [Panicum virgatum]
MQNFPSGYEGSRTTDDRTTMIQQDKQLGEAEEGGSGSKEIEEAEEGSEANIEDGIWRQDIFSTL